MAKYHPEKHIPELARALKTLSPTKLSEEVLKRFNVERSPQSFTMWFKANPEVEEQLRKEQFEGLPTEKQSVDQSIFQNDSFKELPSVKEWINFLRSVRRIKETTINALVASLKQICEGAFRGRGVDFVADGKWCLKHPDRLTYQDAITIMSLMKERKLDLYYYAKALKSFLVNKGISEGSRIMVGRPKGFGKFAKMFVERGTLDAMLGYIREHHSIEPYTMDLLMFKKAFRVHAVVLARVEDFTIENDGTARITLYEKGLERQYGERGKEVTKTLNPEMIELLKSVVQDRKNGLIFSLSADQLGKINNEALDTFAPEVNERFGHVDPNHFWRHMFFQHTLRHPKVRWNYAIAAHLGHCTAKSVEESYGQANPQQVAEWSEGIEL